ncbi:hypothetical protein Tco_1322592, partial [Tanacetum coccineum]
MGTPTQVCVWSCPNFSAPAGRPFRCVKSKNGIVASVFPPLTGVEALADGAQSSRVPVPLPKDPYEAIRQAYLDGTETESEPFEDIINTKTHESPLTIAPTIPLSDSTLPVLVPILRRTARMAVRVPHAMSSGLSASMVEVAAMSESAFRKRFRSSYESSPSVSPPDLPSRKRYCGTSELVKDSDDEEDEEIEKSMDSDSMSEDAKDEGPTAEDEDPAVEDEGLTVGVEGPGMVDEGYGLDDESRGIDDEGYSIESDGLESDGLGLEEEDEAVPEGQQQAAPVVETTVGEPLGLGYRALRRRELAAEEDQRYSTFEVGQGFGSAPDPKRSERVSAFRQPALTTWTDSEDGTVYIDVPTYPPSAPPVQTPPSPDWTPGLLPISPSHSDVPSPVLSPLISLIIPSPVATPTATIPVDEDNFIEIDRDVRELYTKTGAVRDGIFSQMYRLRSLEQEQERAVMTFGALWRPVLALETWAGHVDTRMANMSRAGYDDH